MTTSTVSTLLISCLLTLCACQKQEIKTYRVAKETPPAMPAGQMPAGHPQMGQQMPGQSQMPPMATAEASAGDLTWTAPASWTAKPLGQMRKGSYGIKGDQGKESDLSIFVFPGAAGGLLDNINRWRGQIGLGALSQDKLAGETSSLSSESGLQMVVVDMTGKNDERIIGAILSQETQSWFFKLKGPAALLNSQKDEFLSFLKTVKTR